MISSVLALVAAMGAVQSDPTRTSREAFTNCLRQFVDRAVEDRMTRETFQAEYPQQCTAQEAAFRQALTRANDARMAADEIAYQRENQGETFGYVADDVQAAQAEQAAQQAAAQASQPAQAAQAAQATQAEQPQPEQPQQPPSR